MSEKKKNLILFIVILFVVVIIALVWIMLFRKNPSYPYYEMPRVVFSYRNDGNDIYVFDSEGYIYKISRLSGKTDGLAWLESTIKCLEENREESWLEKVGTTNKEILQEKYNIFRKVIANPKYAVFCTEYEVPNDSNAAYKDGGELTDYWYGHISNTEGMYFYYTGFLKHDVTDKTIYQVVNWICDEVKICDK